MGIFVFSVFAKKSKFRIFTILCVTIGGTKSPVCLCMIPFLQFHQPDAHRPRRRFGASG